MYSVFITVGANYINIRGVPFWFAGLTQLTEKQSVDQNGPVNMTTPYTATLVGMTSSQYAPRLCPVLAQVVIDESIPCDAPCPFQT